MVDQIAPFILMLFNYQLIPLCIDKIGMITKFERKSDRHMSNMNWYFMFLLMNTVILPILGIPTLT